MNNYLKKHIIYLPSCNHIPASATHQPENDDDDQYDDHDAKPMVKNITNGWQGTLICLSLIVASVFGRSWRRRRRGPVATTRRRWTTRTIGDCIFLCFLSASCCSVLLVLVRSCRRSPQRIKTKARITISKRFHLFRILNSEKRQYGNVWKLYLTFWSTDQLNADKLRN